MDRSITATTEPTRNVREKLLGGKEVVITGQHVTFYDGALISNRPTFPLQELAEFDELDREY